jgi:hypothetical protein
MNYDHASISYHLTCVRRVPASVSARGFFAAAER